MRLIIILVGLSCCVAAPAVAKIHTGKQYFTRKGRINPVRGKIARALGLSRFVKQRKVLQVNNKDYANYTKKTAKGHVEFLVRTENGNLNSGHIWLRYADKVYDFNPKGFNVKALRFPRQGDQFYGFLVKLRPRVERRLRNQLEQLTKTNGASLGKYSFMYDKKKNHCTTWISRLKVGANGRSLLKVLGGKSRWSKGKYVGSDEGMPSFSQFLLKKARGVKQVAIYSDTRRSASTLSRHKFKLKTNGQILSQWEALQQQLKANP